MLVDHVDAAESSDELSSIRSGVASAVRTMLEEDDGIFDITAAISGERKALTRRVSEITEREFVESGAGASPVLILRLDGRGESLPAVDQDNAIIYE